MFGGRSARCIVPWPGDDVVGKSGAVGVAVIDS